MIDLSADKSTGKPAIEGFTLEGKGQIVADYASGKKSFHHKDLI